MTGKRVQRYGVWKASRAVVLIEAFRGKRDEEDEMRDGCNGTW